MKIRNLAAPGLALGLATLLLAPTRSDGFTTLGFQLGLGQRDTRLRNTFTDSQANNNSTPHASFPGYVEAEMAVWKGIVEWGSALHGDGSGDPFQLIGSGQANFDPTWQGNGTGIGGINDNIVSASGSNPSCGGGTLAFTESPNSSGWRIIFCDSGITWEDGPGSIGGFNFDIQAVMVHEYGHALGLGHSNDSNATMFFSIGNGDVSYRSINNDDQAGVQNVYGTINSNVKPRIDSISGTITLTITGDNFDGSNNEVWFTQEAAGGTGNPVKAFNVASTGGGTVITVSPPATAGPGDVLVRIPGNGNDRLSNAWPLNLTIDPPVTYCTGKVNNDLCVPFITFTGGAPSVSSTSNFNIRCEDAMANQAGLLIYGVNGRASLNFHNAKLCVKSPLIRLLPPKNAGDDGAPFCSGTFKVNFNNRIQSGADPLLTAGQTVNAQWIYRDPGIDPFGDGLSDGIEFVISQ